MLKTINAARVATKLVVFGSSSVTLWAVAKTGETLLDRTKRQQQKNPHRGETRKR